MNKLGLIDTLKTECQLSKKEAAAVVDIAAVGRAADRDDIRAEIRQRARPDLVTSPVGAVEDDLEAFEVHAVRQAGRAKILVANSRRIDALGLSERLGLECYRRFAQTCFDLPLDLIRQFRAASVEELDAVVEETIVRRADDDAEVRIEFLRQPRDTRRRQRPQEQDVRACRDRLAHQDRKSVV